MNEDQIDELNRSVCSIFKEKNVDLLNSILLLSDMAGKALYVATTIETISTDNIVNVCKSSMDLIESGVITGLNKHRSE